MTGKKQKTEQAKTQVRGGGIPYAHPVTGERCSRAEYVSAVREANRNDIVTALRSGSTQGDEAAPDQPQSPPEDTAG